MAHRVRNVKMRNRANLAAIGQSMIDISRFFEFQDGSIKDYTAEGDMFKVMSPLQLLRNN